MLFTNWLKRKNLNDDFYEYEQKYDHSHLLVDKILILKLDSKRGDRTKKSFSIFSLAHFWQCLTIVTIGSNRI